MNKLQTKLWVLLALTGCLGFMSSAKARQGGYDTNTYVSTNLAIKISALRISLNGSFNNKAYHHGSAQAWLRMDKNISVSYQYRKSEDTGNVSQSYGIYYTITLVE